MIFDAKRIAKLAGVPVRRKNLNESKSFLFEGKHGHSDVEEAYHSEGAHGHSDLDELEELYELDEVDEMEETYNEMSNEMEEMHHDHGSMNEDVIEIDDAALINEVKRIRKQNIQEEYLKTIIEDELKNVLAEMNSDSSWMFGEDKPTKSKSGTITQGFKSIGFK